MKKWIGFSVAILLLSPVAGWCGSDKFVESDEYKDKGFKKCIITDYSNLEEGDDINWVWKKPDIKLADYKLSLGSVTNKSDKEKKSETKAVTSMFQEVFDDISSKGKNGTLVADVCIYEVQDFSYGKAWIPFSGGHQAQAGVGVEMILKDKNQNVAIFRHFGREGARIEEAATEVAEDLTDFIDNN